MSLMSYDRISFPYGSGDMCGELTNFMEGSLFKQGFGGAEFAIGIL